MRKGMMKGKGKGYKNVIGKDPIIHSMSSKGIKQPQRITTIPTKFLIPPPPNSEMLFGVDKTIVKTSNLPNIKINEIMSRDDREKVDNAEIIKFKSKTVSFTDLGYPDKVVYSVLLKGYDEPFDVKVEEKLPTRELNKFKGLKLKDFSSE